jgi:hypothetical protein
MDDNPPSQRRRQTAASDPAVRKSMNLDADAERAQR